MMHNGCEVKDVMQIPRDLFYKYCFYVQVLSLN